VIKQARQSVAFFVEIGETSLLGFHFGWRILDVFEDGENPA